MKLICVLFMLFSVSTVWAEDRIEFTVHKLESGLPGPTVLIVGGIQGDEPGGFHAASLLVTNYKITRGNIWVVPNLNFESIIKSSRGLHGDMNRKFAAVHENDPDYTEVKRIKDLIVDERVDMIFNLHDGSGFYRSEHIDDQRNPRRWGQSIIIDQETLDVERFSNIGVLTRNTVKYLNKKLLSSEHQYSVKNTNTRLGDEEMAKSLTYFAINNGKSAIGIEASKSLPTRERVYYHLNAIEILLSSMGVGWQRNFQLWPSYVQNVIDNNLQIAFYENKLLLDVTRARSRINYVPLQKGAALNFSASNPLVAIKGSEGTYSVSYGNRRVTSLHPQYFEYDTSLDNVVIETNGAMKQVPLGNMVEVSDDFTITPREGYRFNVIGWSKKGVESEAGHFISQSNIVKRFSVDKEGSIYRVEIYKDEKFSGMVLVKFGNAIADKFTAQLPELEEKS